MEILTYTPDLASDLAALYNTSTEQVPNCWSIEAEEFAGAVKGASGAESDGGPDNVEEETILVVAEDGRALGFVHYGFDRAGSEPGGAVCFLCYPRGRRDAGQLLLDTAEKRFSDAGLQTACAYAQQYRYRFYGFDHAFLSDHLDHVSALLQFNGYRKSGGEVFLTGMDYEVGELPDLELEFDLTLDWPQKRGKRPGCHAKAMRGEELLGDCQVDCGGEFSLDPAAQDYGFVNWLGVGEPYQGSGLGKWLLLNTRNEMLQAGYRHTAISTAVDNYRAFLFYSNYGYRVVDWTYGLNKVLGTS